MRVNMLNPSIPLDIHSRGYNVIPLYPATKEACITWTPWIKTRQKSEEVESIFHRKDANIGVVCGEGSGNLVVFDCETPEVFEKIKDIFKEKYPKIVRSIRGGHVYVKTVKPCKTKVYNTTLGKVEVRGQGSYVCAEYSLHPDGKLYELESESFPITALPIIPFGPLEGFEEISVLRHFSLEEDYSKFISSQTYKRIIEGKYVSRSESDFAFIQHFVRLGYSTESVGKLIQKANYNSKYLTLLLDNESLARTWLQSAYLKIQTTPNKAEFDLINTRAKVLSSILHYYPWKGQGGAAEYKVLMAHLEILSRTGKNTFFLSSREGAAMAGLSYAAFNKACKRLHDKGWIYKHPQKDVYSTCQFTLTLENIETKFEINVKERNIPQKQIVDECFTCLRFGVFERGAVGSSQLQIYNHFDSDSGLSTADLSELTDKSLPTLRASLNKLRKAGLVEKRGRLYYRTNETVKSTAISKGCLDKSLSRSYNYNQQQREFQNDRRNPNRKF